MMFKKMKVKVSTPRTVDIKSTYVQSALHFAIRL